MEEKINKLLMHIQILPKDDRDFSHDTLVGTLPASIIPAIDFDIAEGNPLILNQKSLDFCTAFASSEDCTVFKYPNPSLVDYLISKSMPYTPLYRASLAVQFGICKEEKDYLALASSGKNAQDNSKILTALRALKGDYIDPYYQFSKIKQLRNEYTQYGANVREAMLSFVKFGWLLKRESPFTFGEGVATTDKDRNFLANWNNWPKYLDDIASKRKAVSFLSVSGRNDMFDNIRSVLWQNRLSGIKSGVVFGTYWKATWGNALIPDDGRPPEENATGAHCVWVRGQKIINNQIYLVVQNSYGGDAGDVGLFYFPRGIINRNVPIFGAFYFYPVSPASAQYHNENGLLLSSSWIMKFFVIIKNIILNFFKKHD